ncbi:MAG: helix-turn-helix transcriptional regulator [Oscillospiraceae bacterium]|nr:helix-turn-helix transcriptional regulator [Oscillospiraceae bacterium]
MKLNEKLTSLRKEKGLSQNDLSNLLGVSRQAISRWEVGISVPSTENLKCLSQFYGVSRDILLVDHAKVHDATIKQPDWTDRTPNGDRRSHHNQRLLFSEFRKRRLWFYRARRSVLCH